MCAPFELLATLGYHGLQRKTQPRVCPMQKAAAKGMTILVHAESQNIDQNTLCSATSCSLHVRNAQGSIKNVRGTKTSAHSESMIRQLPLPLKRKRGPGLPPPGKQLQQVRRHRR